MKKTRVRWGRVIGTLFCMWLFVGVIGICFGPTQIKHTPVGDYTTKGFPFCIKVASGSNEVAEYLGV